MATGTINLPPLGAILPDGSTNNAAPQFQRTKTTYASSGSLHNTHFVELLFDPATAEAAFWAFRMPEDYASAPVLKLLWKANTITASNVVWEGRVSATTPADVDTPNEHSPAATNSATTAVNTTEARRLIETSITLTNADTVAAGDLVVLTVRRDAANASDTCTVDAELVSVAVNYTTT